MGERFFSKCFKIARAKGMEYGNCENNTCAKFYGGKVHSRMVAGDGAIKNIVFLGDFGEIKDWIPGADRSCNDSN
jgi:hypothetical protein